jgi:hypothetical protein
MTADGEATIAPLPAFMQFVQPLPNDANRQKVSRILRQIYFSAAGTHS